MYLRIISEHFLLSELRLDELAGGPVHLLHLDYTLGAVLKLALGAVCSDEAFHRVHQELALGKVQDRLGVDVHVHRTVHEGLSVLYGAPLLVHAHVNDLSDVRDHVDIISSRVCGLSDTVMA